MLLDIPTLAVLAILVGLELSVGMAIIAHMLGTRPGLRAWTLGLASATAGTLVMALGGVLPQEVVTLGGNTLLLLGTAYTWAGARDYFALPPRMRWVWASVGAELLWLLWFLVVTPSPALRLAGMSLATLAWSVAGFWIFYRRAPALLRPGARFAGFILLLHGVFHVSRLVALFGDVERGLQGGWPLAAVYLAGTMTAIAWVLALVSLTSDRLLMDLREVARTDALTGLLNRGTLEAEGERAVDFCRRQRLPCAVLLFDLDHFKQVNDTFGHAAGDAALRHFAVLVSRELRRSDVFGRYGGEEFCLVMPGAGAAEARQTAERLRALVAGSPALHEERLLPLTVSVGVASGEGDGLCLEALLRRADGALYQAKDGGRDCVLEAAGGG